MTADSIVKARHENIIKSAEDKRLYRGLELHNGMRVLLVSDPTTDKSAASMDVNVGQFTHIGSRRHKKRLHGYRYLLCSITSAVSLQFLPKKFLICIVNTLYRVRRNGRLHRNLLGKEIYKSKLSLRDSVSYILHLSELKFVSMMITA
jgi:hypothetical protein